MLRLGSTPLRRAFGAANTLVNEGGQWTAYNTDVEGFSETACTSYGLRARAKSATSILIGAGGAARAAVASSHEARRENHSASIGPSRMLTSSHAILTSHAQTRKRWKN
jgi:shikimate 5-dehydrogenase